MQSAKKAVDNIKETAANIGASAKSGFHKAKATIQYKSEKMSAHEQCEKDMATQKKEERINQAEMEKKHTREHNAAKQSNLAHMTDPGPGPGPDTATHDTAGPGLDNAIPISAGPGLGQDNIIPTNTGHETATYPAGDYGQMGANQTTVMHGPGPVYGGVTGDAVVSRPIETNPGVDMTAQTTHGGGSDSLSGPGPGPTVI